MGPCSRSSPALLLFNSWRKTPEPAPIPRQSDRPFPKKTTYEQEPWFGKYRPREIRTPSVALDSFLDTMPDFYPTLVKIDVEGAEDRVLSGMRRTLNEANAPTVVMEFLAGRPASSHERAAQLLFETGYTAFFINGQGGLVPVSDIPAGLRASGLESDNIAFRKIA